MDEPGRLKSSAQVYTFSILALVVTAVVYGWLTPSSLEKNSTNYYPQLAIGFKNGNLYLPELPSPALLSLSDPYNYVLRKENNVEDFPWDVSLYEGRFYIYWGPVPSLLLTVLPVGILNRIGDQHLVLPFMLGLFIYSMLFTNHFWFKFNYNLPAWMIGLALLAIGISMPATLILSRPKIYEASIAGCQFFFIGGCFWAFSSISTDGQPALWKFLLAGLHWALAFGTRTIILPAILFFTAVIVFYVVKRNGAFASKPAIQILAAIGIPLALAAALMGWYNRARFGLMTEFGVTYMLTNTDYHQFKDLFSIRYMDENLRGYFFRPYQIQARFPFIAPTENLVSNDRMAGLPYTTPYLLFALIPAIRLFHPARRDENPLEKWMILALGGASVISLVIILSYYFAAMRFAADFMPGFLLLATMGLGQGYRSIDENAKAGKGYLILAVLLAVFSVTASMLIALPAGRVKDVLQYIAQFFEFLGIR